MFRVFIFLSFYFLAGSVKAHSGRTDSKGGHNQYSDGTYHYHNSGTMGNNSGDWSIFTWLIVLFIIYIVGLFIWTYFKEGQNTKTPPSNSRQKHSIPKTPKASQVIRRGADSMAARAAREERSSNTRSRGAESTAAKALKKKNTSIDKGSKSKDLYFDNIKTQQSKSPSRAEEDEKDDLYFDNRVKK